MHVTRIPARWPLSVLMAMLLFTAAAHAATSRWASAVYAVSSEYTATSWAASQALGPPNVWPAHGDVSTAWASATADGQRESIELGFDNAVPINFVAVFETLHPGAIDSVYAWNPVPGQYELLWAGAAHDVPDSSRVWAATFPLTPYAVSRLRITLDSPAVIGWNEIDAVAIGQDAIRMFVPQWASAATASSSYHATGSYSASRATGPPNVYPGYGDNGNAWASLTADGGREWLQLDYAQPVVVSGYRVYETFSPGAIDSIYLRRHDDGSLHLAYSAVPAAIGAFSRVLADTIPMTHALVDGVRLTFASNAVPTWNEIDAVALDVDSLLVPVPPTAAVETASPRGPGALASARPSPFTVSTSLGFTLDRAQLVRLELYDARGAHVRTLVHGVLAAGAHEARWDGADALGAATPPGLYFARLEAGSRVSTRRIVRLR